MKIGQALYERKIGALELLVALFVFALFFASRGSALVTFVLAVGFWFTKREFKGEFSLRDVAEKYLGTKVPADPGAPPKGTQQ